MNVMILCKVVDNYGDIGFVYRLSRALSKKALTQNQNLKLTLVVSNLESFSKMCPGVNPELSVQTLNEWTVLNWNSSRECLEFCKEEFPSVILECFQCGRPSWLEDTLFAKDFSLPVTIINVEYLTAEDWAEDFHLLKSATRNQHVKKINFMPGFTSKTGGLILNDRDEFFSRDIKSKLPQIFNVHADFRILFFSYERSFEDEIKALQKFCEISKKKILVLAAPGLSLLSVLNAVKDFGKDLDVCELPYLSQVEWDSLLLHTDFNFVRGEDSFSRACLSSVPFMWHVYKQEGHFELVKANAFLLHFKPFLPEDLFKTFRHYFLLYNYEKSLHADFSGLAEEAVPIVEELCSDGLQNKTREELFFTLLQNYTLLKDAAQNFSQSLEQNGSLADNLYDYIFSYC